VGANSCIEGSYVVTHETGHIMGLGHDRFTLMNAGESIPPTAYNFGYSDEVTKFRTVMAYFGFCRSKGVDCPILNAYSTPLQNERGAPMGVPQGVGGVGGSADNLRALKENYLAVVNFRRRVP
jgi:hypothetical protein